MHRNKETVTGYHCNTTKITRQNSSKLPCKNKNTKKRNTNWFNRLPRFWDTG